MRAARARLFTYTFYFICIGMVQLSTVAQTAEFNLQDQPKSNSDAELLETLRAAWKRCLSDSEFKAHHQYYEGLSSDKAELSEIKQIEHLNVFAEGFVCKLAQRYRLSRTYAPADREGRKLLQKMSFDEETDGKVFVSFKPGQQSLASQVLVMKLNDDELNIGVMSRPGQLGAISPIHPAGGGGFAGFPLEPHPPFAASDFQVTRLNDNRIRLQAQRKQATLSQAQCDQANLFEVSSKYTIDWILKHDVPVIERAHILIERTGNRAGITEREVRMSDLRDCEGIQLPSRILFLWRGNFRNAAGKPAPYVVVRQWISQDLGQEAPQADDFAIPLEPKTVLIGLKAPIPVRESGHISVVDLKPEDLLSYGDPAPPGSAPSP